MTPMCASRILNAKQHITKTYLYNLDLRHLIWINTIWPGLFVRVLMVKIVNIASFEQGVLPKQSQIIRTFLWSKAKPKFV